MLDKLGKENWDVFQKRYGLVIPNYDEASRRKHIELLESRNGLPIVRITISDGKKIFLHSSIDPIREAEKVAQKVEASPGSFVVVYGFALGYLVEALLNKIDEKVPLFVIEPDRALFCAALNTRDLRPVLSSERVFIIAPSDEGNELITNFSAFYDLTRYNKMVITGLSGHQAAYADAYQKTVRQLRDAVNSKMINFLTLQEIGTAMMSNAIRNLPIYYTSPGLKTLYAQFKDMPAIIVSAGPSLNKNIHLLKEAKGKAVILAVGTAVKALLKEGIEPDFIVSIDPVSLNYEHFKGVNIKHAALITEIQSYPEVLESYSGTIFVSGSMSILKWFDGVIEEKGMTESGGSVANNAMTAAYKLGANPIIFVGQDLAYGKDGHSHAAGTNYENIVYDGGENRNYFFVKANDGGQVLTTRAYYQFLKFFQNWIKKHSQPEYINATEGGAFIEGTKIMPLQKVLEQYCVKRIDVQEIIKDAVNSFIVPDFVTLSARIDERLAEVKNIINEAQVAIKCLDQLEVACNNEQAKKIKRRAKEVKRIYEKFEHDKMIRDVVEWFANNELQQVFYRTNQADFNEDDDYHAAIADYKLYYEKIINGAKVAQGFVEDCITQIEGRVSEDVRKSI